MARTFGTYGDLEVPLGVTWPEDILLLDSAGDPIDITDFHIRSQFHAERPIRDPDTGEATVPPVFEMTTPGYYGATPPQVPVPSWPVFEAWAEPTTPVNRLLLDLPAEDTWTASPTNERVRLYFDIRIKNKTTGAVLPIVQDVAMFTSADTL